MPKECLPVTAERYLSQCIPEGDCLIWPRGRFRSAGIDYACLNANRRSYLGHRLIYELVKGPIPEGLTIDHLCSRGLCINPAHLEAVTQSENTRRVWARGRGRSGQSLKTTCPQGHPYDGVSTRGDGSTFRVCKRCKNDWTTRARGGDPDAPRPKGRPAALSAEEQEQVRADYARGGVTQGELAEAFGVHRNTIYRLLSRS